MKRGVEVLVTLFFVLMGLSLWITPELTGLAVQSPVNDTVELAAPSQAVAQASILQARIANKPHTNRVFIERVVERDAVQDVDATVTSLGKQARIEIRGAAQAIERIQAVPLPQTLRVEGRDVQTRTEAVAVNNITIESATITLPKTGEVTTILHCADKNWNENTGTCTFWEDAGLSFTQDADFITFNVTHFSAYAGGFVDESGDSGVWSGTKVNLSVTVNTLALTTGFTTGTYESTTIDAGQNANFSFMNFTGSLGDGNITFQIASSPTDSGFTFIGPDNTANTYYNVTAFNTLIPINTTINRYFRYKLYFDRGGTTTPTLTAAVVRYHIVDDNNASSDTTRLAIFDENEDLGYYSGQNLTVYANYTDFASGAPISTGSCDIYIDTGLGKQYLPMTYNPADGLYNRSVWTNSLSLTNLDYSVNCSAPSYDTLNVSQTRPIRFVCDSGTTDDTCVVTTSHEISSNTTIKGSGNLDIISGGIIEANSFVYGTTDLSLVFDGNITVKSGGLIQTIAPTCSSGGCVSTPQAGSLSANASILNVSGTLRSFGGALNRGGYKNGFKAGQVNITSNEIYVSGYLGVATGAAGQSRGPGIANDVTIISNTTKIFSSGQISAPGGDTSSADNYGGNAGKITINTSIFISEGNIIARGGGSNDLPTRAGSGGNITIHSTFLNFSGITVDSGTGNAFSSSGDPSAGNIFIEANETHFTGVTLNALHIDGSNDGSITISIPAGGNLTQSSLTSTPLLEIQQNSECPYYNITGGYYQTVPGSDNVLNISNFKCSVETPKTYENITIENSGELVLNSSLTVNSFVEIVSNAKITSNGYNLTAGNLTQTSGIIDMNDGNISVSDILFVAGTIEDFTMINASNFTVVGDVNNEQESLIYADTFFLDSSATFDLVNRYANTLFFITDDVVIEGNLTRLPASTSIANTEEANVSITAQEIKVPGRISVEGSCKTSATGDFSGNIAGTIRLVATNISINGTLRSVGDDCSGSADGGKGGEIFFNATNVTISSATVDAFGGRLSGAQNTLYQGGHAGKVTIFSTYLSIDSTTFDLSGGIQNQNGEDGNGGIFNATADQIIFSNINIDTDDGGSATPGNTFFNINSGGNLSFAGTNTWTVNPAYIQYNNECPYYNSAKGLFETTPGSENFVNITNYQCNILTPKTYSKVYIDNGSLNINADTTVQTQFTQTTSSIINFYSGSINVLSGPWDVNGTLQLFTNLTEDINVYGNVTFLDSPLEITGTNFTVQNGGHVYSSPATLPIFVNVTENIFVHEGGKITTNEQGSTSGDAGDITLIAGDTLTIDGQIISKGRYRSAGTQVKGGYFAGLITLAATNVTVGGNISSIGLSVATISTGFYDGGKGGLVNISARNVKIETSNWDLHGGDVSVTNGHRSYLDGGDAGDVSIFADEVLINRSQFVLYGGGNKPYLTQRDTYTGNGGNVLISTKDVTIVNTTFDLKGGKEISSLGSTYTNVRGRGGNLTLDAQNNTLLSDVVVDADAESTYPDGNVSITRECGYERSLTLNNVNSTIRQFQTTTVESDSDVIANYCDNCILVNNLDQNDTYDGDGVGDACDAHIEFLLDGQNDTFVDINQKTGEVDPANTFRLYAQFVNDQTGDLYGVGDGNNPADIDFFIANITNATSGEQVYARAVSATNTLEGDQINGRVLLSQFVPTTYNLTFSAQATGSAGTVADEINTTITFKNITFTSSMLSTQLDNNTPVVTTLTALDENGAHQSGTVNLSASDEFPSTTFTLSSGSPTTIGTTTNLGLHQLTFDLIMPLLLCEGHSSCLTSYTERVTQGYETFLATLAQVNVSGADRVPDSIIDIDEGNITVRAAYLSSTSDPLDGEFNITLKNSTFSITKNCAGFTQSICEKNFSTQNLALSDLAEPYTVIVNISNPSANYKPQNVIVSNVLLRNISTSSELDKNRYFQGDVFTLNGTANLVGSNLVSGATAHLFIDNVFNTSTAVLVGPPSVYEFTSLPVPSGGIHTLRVVVNTSSGIEGEDALTMGVFQFMNVSTAYTYTLPDGNLTVFANYTNSTGSLQPGNINITVVDLAGKQQSKFCSGASQCIQSFLLGELESVDAGNITIIATGENESFFFNTSTNITKVFLYAKDTITSLTFPRVIITDRTLGNFSTNATFTITNAGFGNLTNANITLEGFVNLDNGGTPLDPAKVFANQTFFFCGDLNVSDSCTFNVTVNISEDTPNIDIGAIFRINHTNLDGTLTSKQTNPSEAVIEIAGVPALEVEHLVASQEHATTKSYLLKLNNTGNEIAESINLTFQEISWSPDLAITVDIVTPSNILNGIILQICDFLSIFLGTNGCGALPWINTYEELNITITANPGTPPGFYRGRVEIKETPATPISFATTYADINITIPVNSSWTLTPLQSNISLPLSKPGIIQTFEINNTGNVDLNFTLTKIAMSSILDITDPQTNAEYLFLAKQSSTTHTLKHKVLTSAQNIQGTFRVANASATPTQQDALLNISVENQIPLVTLINKSDDPIDVNRPLIIYFNASNDDIGQSSGLPTNLAGCNATLGATTVTAPAQEEGVDTNGFEKNFSCSITLPSAGTWTIKPFATDAAGQVGNTSFIIQAIGTTTATVTPNTTSASVSGVSSTTSKSVFFNITATNTGDADMYNAVFSAVVSAIPGATVNTQSVALIENGTSASGIIEVIIPAGTIPLDYVITPKVSWTNADGTNVQQLSLQTITITVEEFVELALTNTTPIITAAQHNTTLNLTYNLTSAGNTNAQNIELVCVGDCFSSTFTPSSISSLSGVTQINQTLTIPFGQAPDSYNFVVIARAPGADKNASIAGQITVIGNSTWKALPPSVTQQFLAGQTPSIGFSIINFANQQLNFSFDLIGGITSIATTPSDFNLAAATNGGFTLDLSTPSTTQTTTGTLNITCASCDPLYQEIPLTIETYNITISNVSITPSSDVSPSSQVDIGFLAALDATPLTTANFADLSVEIGGVNATITNTAYNAPYFNLTVTAPSVGSQLLVDVNITGNYTPAAFNQEYNLGQVTYLDLVPPTLANESTPDTPVGSAATISVDVTDNDAVNTVTATVAGTTYTLTPTGNTYSTTLPVLPKGDYPVTFTANDTQGNTNTLEGYFIVYTNTTLSGTLDPTGNLSNITVEFINPNNNQTLFNESFTNPYTITIYDQDYDLIIFVNNAQIKLKGVPNTALTGQLIQAGIVPEAIRPASDVLNLQGFGINTSLTFTSGELSFTYDPSSVGSLSDLDIYKCADWNLTSKTCSSNTWTSLGATSANGKTTANITSFSAYVLGQKVTSASSGSGSSGGGGGGGGGISRSTFEEGIQNIIEQLAGISVDTQAINLEVLPGERVETEFELSNKKSTGVQVTPRVEGNARILSRVIPSSMTLESGQKGTFTYRVQSSENAAPGIIQGKIILDISGSELTIPVTIRILEPPKVALAEPEVSIRALTRQIVPNGTLSVALRISNPEGFYKRFDAEIEAINIATGEQAFATQQTYEGSDPVSETLVFNLTGVPLGEYTIKSKVKYTSREGELRFVTDQDSFKITPEPITLGTVLFAKVWLFAVWQYLAALLLLGLLIAAAHKGKEYWELHKKYQHIIVDHRLLPQPGERSAYVGLIAETHIRAFINLESLTTHTIIAGATGGGKTISAQDIVEEALDHNVAVVVFDPTGQWSGFLRPCTDKSMLKLYPHFGMSIHDAKGYKGNIFHIENPREYLDLQSRIKPGFINIINISKIDPKELDIFVANTIRQIFKMNLPESKTLKTLFVYDEVHRLLPKFGGSGAGFIQIERACREFRKWGVGVLLVSQVLSDFVGEIKANINTEIQMRTKSEGDLERVKNKYGDAILHALIKASVGTGMIQNAEYNKGRPYLISFRPLKHSPQRLSDKELNLYSKYNNQLADIEYQIQQLKDLKQDTFDVELELKLAKDKLMEGKFTMVDIYIDGLVTKLKSQFAAAGATPKQRQIKLIPQEEIEADIAIAQKERERYTQEMIKKHGKDYFENKKKGIEKPPAPKEPKKSEDPVLHFLERQRAKGLTDDQIKKKLLEHGWKEKQIEKLFKKEEQEKKKEKPSKDPLAELQLRLNALMAKVEAKKKEGKDLTLEIDTVTLPGDVKLALASKDKQKAQQLLKKMDEIEQKHNLR